VCVCPGDGGNYTLAVLRDYCHLSSVVWHSIWEAALIKKVHKAPALQQ